MDAALPTGRGSLLPVGERAVRPEEEGGEHRGIHRPIGDGGRAAKKISVRVARHYAREAQYRAIEYYREKYPVSTMCAYFDLYASQLLRLAQTGEAARPGWSPDGTGPRSLPVLARGLRLSAGADVDRATQRDHDQSQGCSEADEPDGDSLGGEEAQASSQRARDGQAVPLSQPAQPGLLCGAAQPKMGHRYDPHPAPSKAGPRCARSKIFMMGSSWPIASGRAPRSSWWPKPSGRRLKKKWSLMDSSSTVTRDINSAPKRIMS